MVPNSIFSIKAPPLSLNLFLGIMDQLVDASLLLFCGRKFLFEFLYEIVDDVFLFLEFVELENLWVLKGEGDVVRDEFQALKVGLDIKVLKVRKVMLELLNGVRRTLLRGDFCLVKCMFGEDFGDELVSFDVGNNLIDDLHRLIFKFTHYFCVK